MITKSVWGGAQRYVFDLATNLPKDQFDVAVVAGGQGSLVMKLNRAGIRVIPLLTLERDVSFFKEIISLWSLTKIFIREKPDIIHLSSSKAGGLGAVAARLALLVISHCLPRREPGVLLRGSSVIFTIHGWPFNEDRPWWQRSTIFFFSWLSTIFQDKIILIDSADYSAAERFIPRKKLALIRHGIAPIDFLPRQEARSFLAGKIGQELEPETQVIGTIAELIKNKGLKYLISCADQVKSKIQNPNFKVIIIGEGENHTELQQQIAALKLIDTVFIIGFVPDAQRYLSGFDIFVLPSVKEGLPYSLMEAMAAGVPVVATNVGGIPDLIENQKSGLLVPPKNAQAIGEAVLTLIAGPDERRALGYNAKKKIEESFGINAMITKTLRVYTA